MFAADSGRLGGVTPCLHRLKAITCSQCLICGLCTSLASGLWEPEPARMGFEIQGGFSSRLWHFMNKHDKVGTL